MFFQERNINELMQCPLCKIKFTDPRILSCGETVCVDCIKLLYDQVKKGIHLLQFLKPGFKIFKTQLKTNIFEGIDCPICNEFHQCELEIYFPPNKLINRLLRTKPEEVYRGKIANDLKLQLNEIFSKICDLKNDMKTDKSKIKEYCDLICNNIVEATEKAQNYLEKHRVAFMKQIDMYEVESQNMFEFSDEINCDIDKFIEELYIFRMLIL